MFEGRSLVHSPCRTKDCRQTFRHEGNRTADHGYILCKGQEIPEEMRDLISFEEPITRSLSDLETSIRICDKRNAGYRNVERGYAKYSRIDRPMAHYEPQRNYSPLQNIHPLGKEDRSRYLNNREVSYFNEEPYYGRRFIQPPKSLTNGGSPDWSAFRLKCERFCRQQMFSD